MVTQLSALNFQASMSEWCNNHKQSSNNFHRLLQERIEKANPRRDLTAKEAKRLAKLEAIVKED